ncbi:hypothetical protein [Demequina pelophila]|uniref:hypothetical protein n=1 Tax=Demequina pelophila TaxID=1638984 RepID=UPI0007844EF8|nr:hypothetical protein [Demequina pelophila]
MPSGRRSSKRPYGRPHEELDVDRVWGNRARLQPGPRGEDYYVAIPRPTDRTYVCPACQGEISGEVQHIVAWPADGLFGADAAAGDRRHWHTGCWNSFGRR